MLCLSSQKSFRNVLNKKYYCSTVPSGQLKCSFENPAVTFSPGVSKNLPKSGKENVRKKFFSKNYSSERCSGLVDGSFDVPAEKKNVKSGKSNLRSDRFWEKSQEDFFKRKSNFIRKVRLDIEKARLTTLMKKVGRRS